jgi:putative ABC transport system permease protein
VRVALGATHSDVLGILLAQSMRYVLAGVAGGLVLSFVLAGFLKTLLFRISATDALTFTMVPLLLIGVAFAACYLPARRAAQANPLTSLRHE